MKPRPQKISTILTSRFTRLRSQTRVTATKIAARPEKREENNTFIVYPYLLSSCVPSALRVCSFAIAQRLQ